MQRKNLYKSISCAIAGIGLSMGAVQSANALSHALAIGTVSDLEVAVDGAGISFANTVFLSDGTANSSTADGFNGNSGGTDLARTESGDYYAGDNAAGNPDENVFTAQALPGGSFAGAYVDTNMPDTGITFPQATGVNVQMIAESATQGPPVPASANSATSQFSMLWKFPAGAVTAGQTITFRGSMLSTIIEELLAPTTGGDVANASITFSVQVGLNSSDNATFDIVDGIGVVTDLSTTHTVAADDFDGNNQLDFNLIMNIQANTVSNTLVPEPGSLALMGGGLLMLGAVSRRRARKFA